MGRRRRPHRNRHHAELAALAQALRNDPTRKPSGDNTQESLAHPNGEEADHA